MKLYVILAILPAVLAAPAASRDEPAPLLIPRGSKQLIADKYIVKFKDSISIAAVDETVNALSKKADHVYTNTFRGFAGQLSAKDVQTLRERPDVSCRPLPTHQAMALSLTRAWSRSTTLSKTPFSPSTPKRSSPAPRGAWAASPTASLGAPPMSTTAAPVKAPAPTSLTPVSRLITGYVWLPFPTLPKLDAACPAKGV